jgi:hypothetical protein
MKRTLILLLSASLLSLPAVQAHAEPTLGGACKREGEIANMPIGKLICTKVGKVMKYVSATGGASGTSGITPDKNVNPIALKAYSSYNHSACKSKHPNFNATYLTSPSYSPALLAKQKSLFEQAMSCYSDYFDHAVSINIALVSQNDYEFLAAQTSDGKPVFDEKRLSWAKFMMQRIGSGAGRFAGSAGWSNETNSAWVLMVDSSTSTSPDEHGAAHEFVHILQSFSKSAFFPFYGDGSTDADYVNLPPWFWEGTAELFSYDSISSSAGIFSAQMASARMQGKESPSLNKITSTIGVISTLQKLEAPSNQEANMMNYALGSVACEYLLATYGYAKYWTIMKNAGVYKDFNENLKATIGLTQDQLFSKAAPFVLSQWLLSKF